MITAHDGLGTSVTKTVHLTVVANTGVPPVRQPIDQIVTPGTLTLSCTHAVSTTATAVTTCPLLYLSPIKLNGHTQVGQGLMNTVYVVTARGNPLVGWTLSASMTVTSHTVNTNTHCWGLYDFCNATIGPYASTAARGQIPAGNLALGDWSCIPAATNANPAPSTGADGGVFSEPSITLCTSTAAESGGTFSVGGTTVKPAGFELTVPSSVYAGQYYGTVEYLLVSD